MWKKLNHILIEKGMTKKELAEKAGISKNTIQNIRNSKISFRNMVKIADALDVSLDEFRKDNTWNQNDIHIVDKRKKGSTFKTIDVMIDDNSFVESIRNNRLSQIYDLEKGEIIVERIIAISVEELFEKVAEQEKRLSEIEKRLGIISEDAST